MWRLIETDGGVPEVPLTDTQLLLLTDLLREDAPDDVRLQQLLVQLSWAANLAMQRLCDGWMLKLLGASPSGENGPPPQPELPSVQAMRRLHAALNEVLSTDIWVSLKRDVMMRAYQALAESLRVDPNQSVDRLFSDDVLHLNRRDDA